MNYAAGLTDNHITHEETLHFGGLLALGDDVHGRSGNQCLCVCVSVCSHCGRKRVQIGIGVRSHDVVIIDFVQ